MLSETTVDYGSAITAPEAPAKEGYTFEGWEDFPETMPAHDLTVNGKYTVNQYKLTVYLEYNIVSEEMVDYGTVLDIPIPEAPKGYKFDRWLEKIPETMPAYDLEIHGVTRVDELSSVATMYGDGAEEVDVYSVTGQLLLRQVRLSEIDLVPGIYIIAGRKILVR